ncbi:MAG: DUF4159 domain-containing protein [Acetobacterales bacterium]
MGSFAFAAPGLLLALLALPAIWWLLRITPPAPQMVRFPAIRLLFGLTPQEETPAHSPLWLLLLRLLMAALLILALAQPLLHPSAGLAEPGPVVAVVDDGWAAARDWEARRNTLESILDAAEREGREVMLLTTAPSEQGGAVRSPEPTTADDARRAVGALEPKPWPTDRAALVERLEGLQIDGRANVYWLSDGLDDGAARQLAARLSQLGPLRVFIKGAVLPAMLMRQPESDASGLLARVSRSHTVAAQAIQVLARGADGRVLAREPLIFDSGDAEGSVRLELPPEVRNRLARLEIADQRHAGAVALLDERWRRRPVGMVSGTPAGADQPLLGNLFYLERALAPFTELRRGGILELLGREIAVIALADVAAINPAERAALETWIQEGGVLVRFAGPETAREADTLLPVRLRAGDRILGGAMSWSEPAPLASFPLTGPFRNLEVPEEVVVRRQVLAEPSLDLAGKTWARLADGTPIVTGEHRGEGWLVLFHTTANGDWSSLPLSGLFVNMLRRIVELSHGIVEGGGAVPLNPLLSVDAFGDLAEPPASARPLTADEIGAATVGPDHPPGFYGTNAMRRALNLGASVDSLQPITGLPASAAQFPYGGRSPTSLMPWLLAIVLLLATADVFASLHLRGLLRRPAGVAIVRALPLLFAVSMLTAAAPAFAQGSGAGVAGSPQARALAATLDTRLGYIVTGNERVDTTSRAGLIGLSQNVNDRTAAQLAEPMGVDVEADDLAFFPLLYWPTVSEQPTPSPEAFRRLNEYLEFGGIILFDTRDRNSGATNPFSSGRDGIDALRRVTAGLHMPALAPIPEDHVLSRSFYLLQDFPGRWTGSGLWVQRDVDRANDSVSSVIIGSHDWGGAWAVGADGRPLYPVVPGGSRQREIAYRFGINLVMYALTGNYKGDQVHVPIILERLGQ